MGQAQVFQRATATSICCVRVFKKAEEVLKSNDVQNVKMLQHVVYTDLALPSPCSAGLKGVLRAAIEAVAELREASAAKRRNATVSGSGSQPSELEAVLDRVLNPNKSYVLVDQEAKYKEQAGSLFTFVPEVLWPPHMAVSAVRA